MFAFTELLNLAWGPEQQKKTSFKCNLVGISVFNFSLQYIGDMSADVAKHFWVMPRNMFELYSTSWTSIISATLGHLSYNRSIRRATELMQFGVSLKPWLYHCLYHDSQQQQQQRYGSALIKGITADHSCRQLFPFYQFGTSGLFSVWLNCMELDCFGNYTYAIVRLPGAWRYKIFFKWAGRLKRQRHSGAALFLDLYLKFQEKNH